MDTREEKFEIDLTARQSLAWDTLDESGVDQVLYGGAKGGGKSVFACYKAYSWALGIINKFDLQPSRFPIPVGWMGRLVGKHFQDTTLQTWHRFIPPSAYRINEQKHEIVIAERVKIDYGGLDTGESIHKFNSAEYGFIVVDQAEEVTKDKIAVLLASRRLQINGEPLDYKALFTANPAVCWLKDEFILSPPANKRFVQALPSDNQFLPAEYIEILRDAFRNRPDLLAAYLEGDWDAFEGDDQLILARWIEECCRIKSTAPVARRFISCDPADMGDDETVMFLFHDSDIVAQRIYAKRSAPFVANILHTWALQTRAQAIVIDRGHTGSAIAQLLEAMAGGHYNVIKIDYAGRPRRGHRYLNVRAEMWATAADMLADGHVHLSCSEWMSPADWQTLKGQLCSPRYDFREGGKLYLEKKAEIKKRLGSSPDRGDCAVQGWYAMERITAAPPEDTGRGYGKRKKRPRRSAMAA